MLTTPNMLASPRPPAVVAVDEVNELAVATAAWPPVGEPACACAESSSIMRARHAGLLRR